MSFHFLLLRYDTTQNEFSCNVPTQFCSKSSRDMDSSLKAFFIAKGNSGSRLPLKNSIIFTSCRATIKSIAFNAVLLYSYSRKSGNSWTSFLPASLEKSQVSTEYRCQRIRLKVAAKGDMGLSKKKIAWASDLPAQ